LDSSIGFLQNLFFQASVWAIPVLLAITRHEAAHAYVAWICGDPTARSLGRVTLNPIAHIDRFGTIVLPILCLISPLGLVFGYAKPVPVDFRRLRNPRRDMMLVAAAGPAANVLLLVLSAILLHLASVAPDWLGDWLAANLYRSVLLNAILAVFNLIPVPPLDGGRIVTGLLPYSLAVRYAKLERFGILAVIGVLFLLPALASALNYDLGIMKNILAIPIYGLMDLVMSMVGPR
jgi:Zn-dependent protease